MKINAFRCRLIEPIEGWIPNTFGRLIFYGIINKSEVQTTNGTMSLIELSSKAELADPTIEVMVQVGRVGSTMGPELYFWKDRFWLQARSKSGIAWYRDSRYLLYPVEVRLSAECFAQVIAEHNEAYPNNRY